MNRRHWLEIEDQPWCPRVIRDAVTDSLQCLITLTRAYSPVVRPLARALSEAKAPEILDLCSGGAGPWLWLRPALAKAGVDVSVCLSDKYPNLEAFQRAHRHSQGAILYQTQSIDARSVPARFKGFRTLFTSFHHFHPQEARAVLANALEQGRGIGVFEATSRHPQTLFYVLLFPIAVWLVTPWLRPFRWSRLLWTYLLPLVPLVTLFDGLISCLRTYSVDELRELVRDLDGAGYHWEVQVTRQHLLSVPITYLIGLPAVQSSQDQGSGGE